MLALFFLFLSLSVSRSRLFKAPQVLLGRYADVTQTCLYKNGRDGDIYIYPLSIRANKKRKTSLSSLNSITLSTRFLEAQSSLSFAYNQGYGLGRVMY